MQSKLSLLKGSQYPWILTVSRILYTIMDSMKIWFTWIYFFWKVIFCSGDTAATYKISNTSLEYDAIFEKRYATTIVDLYTEITLIQYIKVTSIHCLILSKKDTTWNIDINNLSVCSLQRLLLLILMNMTALLTKMKNFTTLQWMTCLISFLQQAYKLEIFTLS